MAVPPSAQLMLSQNASDQGLCSPVVVCVGGQLLQLAPRAVGQPAVRQRHQPVHAAAAAAPEDRLLRCGRLTPARCSTPCRVRLRAGQQQQRREGGRRRSREGCRGWRSGLGRRAGDACSAGPGPGGPRSSPGTQGASRAGVVSRSAAPRTSRLDRAIRAGGGDREAPSGKRLTGFGAGLQERPPLRRLTADHKCWWDGQPRRVKGGQPTERRPPPPPGERGSMRQGVGRAGRTVLPTAPCVYGTDSAPVPGRAGARHRSVACTRDRSGRQWRPAGAGRLMTAAALLASHSQSGSCRLANHKPAAAQGLCCAPARRAPYAAPLAASRQSLCSLGIRNHDRQSDRRLQPCSLLEIGRQCGQACSPAASQAGAAARWRVEETVQHCRERW